MPRGKTFSIEAMRSAVKKAEKRSPAEVAAIMNIHPTTINKWRKRLAARDKAIKKASSKKVAPIAAAHKNGKTPVAPAEPTLQQKYDALIRQFGELAIENALMKDSLQKN